MRHEDAFSQCHPMLNFFYFAAVLIFTMFNQHPVFLAISFFGAESYAVWLNGAKKTLKMNLLFTLPGILIIALINPVFNHYGVTPLVYLERSGNAVTLEALVYGLVSGCVMFTVIEWFSCYHRVMTSDKFIYLFGRVIPAMSLMLSMALRFVPRLAAQLRVIRNAQKCSGRDISNAGFIKKLKYGADILSILVTWALENAIETANAMKSRGYGLPGRTAFSIYRLTKRDRLLGLLMLSLFVVCTCGCARGAAFASYQPVILLAGFAVGAREAPVECSRALSVLTFAAFACFCLTPLILGIAQEQGLKRSRRRVGEAPELTYRRIYEELEEARG